MIRVHRISALTGCIIAIGAACPAFADTPPVPVATPVADREQTAKDITAEVLRTTAPAFAALDVSGETITEPEGLKTAAMSLINGTDTDGNPVNGIGVQFAPAQLIPGLRVGFNAYSARPNAFFHGPRAWARLQITGAYVRGVANDASKPERAAIGAIWVPYDNTDPFVNQALTKCVDDADVNNPLPPGQAPALGQAIDLNPPLTVALKNCRKIHTRSATTGVSSQIGFAKLFRNRDGGEGSLVGTGFAANAVVSIGLDCMFSSPCRATRDDRSKIGGKLLLGAVIRERELVANPQDTKSMIDRNRQSFGGKFVFGDAEAWWLGLELLHQNATYEGLGVDKYTTYSVGLDVRISKGLWLAANYGGSSGQNFGNTSQFLAGLKFAVQPSFSGGS